jgi:hypothetical protein
VVVSISYGGRQLGAAASVVALHFAEDFALERCRTVSRASVNETLGSGARTFLAGRYSIT